MTETKSLHTRDSSELQDNKHFLTLKGIVTSPACFLCNQDLSGPCTAIDLDSHIQVGFHNNCYGLMFKLFDVLFGESLKYYLENGFQDLFKKDKDLFVNIVL